MPVYQHLLNLLNCYELSTTFLNTIEELVIPMTRENVLKTPNLFVELNIMLQYKSTRLQVCLI